MPVDSTAFRQTMAQWTTGVTVVTTAYHGEVHGMTASSFTSLSISPLLVSVSINKSTNSHDLIKNSGYFAVNILDMAQIEIGKRFAGMYPEIEDRFSGTNYTTAESGSPILEGIVAWLDCKIYETYEGGDHTIFVGEVLATGINSGKSPLIYSNRQWGMFKSLETRSSPQLTHIVMFRLHENTNENYHVIRQSLIDLRTKIPQIRHIEVGQNIIPSDRAYDIALTVMFDSLADMEIYQAHPAHLKVVNEIIKPRISSAVAVNYENN